MPDTGHSLWDIILTLTLHPPPKPAHNPAPNPTRNPDPKPTRNPDPQLLPQCRHIVGASVLRVSHGIWHMGVWMRMGVYGCLWVCMDPYGCMDAYGCVWVCAQVFCVYRMVYMAYEHRHLCACVYIYVRTGVWMAMGVHRCVRLCMGVYGCVVCMGVYGCARGRGA